MKLLILALFCCIATATSLAQVDKDQAVTDYESCFRD